jgi:hypothetical protein
MVDAASSKPFRGKNPDSPNLYRQEAKVVQAMSAGLPVPHLIEVIDDGEWVVLVFEEIEGRPPPLPWSLADLRAVFVALDELAELAAPSLMRSLPSLGERLGASLSGYRRLAGGDPAVERIDAWSRRHLQRLAELEASLAGGHGRRHLAAHRSQGRQPSGSL